MALSEIEKLERRYAENPQGLTFAPLAEVHRKNGDVPRALELLKPGLAIHPDYIPASIVLGRCHFDLGELPAAEAAFTHVLSLDGENVIALKALADITERQYRFEEAERWLRTLLAVDRSNDEARDQLSRVEASRRQAEVASSATPDAVGAPDQPGGQAVVEAPAGASADAGAAGGPESTADRDETAAPGEAQPDSAALDDLVSAEPRPISLSPDSPSEVVGWVEDRDGALAGDATPLELADLELHVQPGSPEGIELEQPVSLAEPVEPISGLTGRDREETAEAAPRASGGFQVELSEDIVLQSAGGSEFQMANASEELLSAPPPARRSDPLMPDLPSISVGHHPAEAESVAAVEPETTPAEAASTGLEKVAGDERASELVPDRAGTSEGWSGIGAADAAESKPSAAEAPASTTEPTPWDDGVTGSLAATTSWPTLEAVGHVAEPTETADRESATADAATSDAAGTGSDQEPATDAVAVEAMAEDGAEEPAASSALPEAESAPATAGETTAGSNGRDAAHETPSAWREPLAELPQPPEPDLVVTESMADLLLQQGHTAEALTVYRHLAARTSSERVRARIAELEQGLEGHKAAAEPAAPKPEPAVPALPQRAYSVQQTQGQSVQAFLRGILAGRLPAAAAGRAPAAAAPREAEPGPEGAPTRPAHDSLSLSSVFGDDATPTPPAVSSAVPAAGGGGVSYDEFYGAGGSAPVRTTRTPDPKSDDLDQFHAWLQNLKR